MLNQFFGRAVYYAILGYDEARQQSGPKSDLRRVQELAVSFGLMSAPTPLSKILQD